MTAPARSREVTFGYADDLFLRELREGYGWQLYVAAFLRSHGLRVETTALRFRETAADAPAHRNEPDIMCAGLVIEVKSRRLRFTGPGDYPTACLPAFVDTVSGWDAKRVKPFAVVLISRPTGAMVVLNGQRSREWDVLERRDRVRGIDERFYAAARDLLLPVERLVTALRRRQEERAA